MLRVDPSRLSDAYRHAPLAAQHRVAGGGPLAPSAVSRLVRDAVPRDVERTGTVLGPDADAAWALAGPTSSPLVTVRGVEHRGPQYAALFEAVVADLQLALPGEVASGRATLDLHVGGPLVLGPSRVSSRHRIVLQVRGTLELHVGASEGLTVVRDGDDGRPDRERIFPLTAGHAAYVPAGRRAWGVVGPEGGLMATFSWRAPARGEWRRSAARRAVAGAPIPVSGPVTRSSRGRVCMPVRARHG